MKFTLLSLLTVASLAATSGASTCYVYVGSYTTSAQEGITLLRMDEASGKLENLGIVVAAPNPTFLAVDTKGEFLYAVYEKNPGFVAAYQIDRASGKLKLLNTQSSAGDGPCHVTVDRARQNVLVSNYNSGSVACLPIKADGSLAPASSQDQHAGHGPDAQRQEGPHAHGAYLSLDEKFAVVADLGTDHLDLYHFDGSKGALTKHDPPAALTVPGAGPRHGVFSADGTKFYTINELDSTVTAYAWNGVAGTLKSLQSLPTLSKPVKGNSTAEIALHPNGKVLYGSNRGDNSLVRYAVDSQGKLTYVDHTPTTGPMPRHFAIHPEGKWLLAANQDSNQIVTFAVEPAAGKLTMSGPSASVIKPVCLVYLRIP